MPLHRGGSTYRLGQVGARKAKGSVIAMGAVPDRKTEIRVRLDRLRAGDGSALEELLTLSGDRLARLAHKMLRGFPRVHR
jgi:hypothetical protein